MQVQYTMPGFTTKQAAKAMSEPHGLRLTGWRRQDDGSHRATFEAPTQEAIDGFSADLDYGPTA